MSWILNPLKDNKFWTWRAEMFSNEELDKIVELGTALQSQHGVALGEDPEYRRSNISWMHTDANNSWIYNTLTWNVQTVNRDYFEYDLTHIEPLQFTEYNSTYQGHYGPHLDIGKNMGGARKLTFILQLSDPTDYEGGEVRLHLNNTPFPIPKERGKLIFFPSWVLHDVTPVTKGIRRSLVGWVAGPKFK
jgi:PKHD-type hydroxylase